MGRFQLANAESFSTPIITLCNLTMCRVCSSTFLESFPLNERMDWTKKSNVYQPDDINSRFILLSNDWIIQFRWKITIDVTKLTYIRLNVELMGNKFNRKCGILLEYWFAIDGSQKELNLLTLYYVHVNTCRGLLIVFDLTFGISIEQIQSMLSYYQGWRNQFLKCLDTHWQWLMKHHCEGYIIHWIWQKVEVTCYFLFKFIFSFGIQKRHSQRILRKLHRQLLHCSVTCICNLCYVFLSMTSVFLIISLKE